MELNRWLAAAATLPVICWRSEAAFVGSTLADPKAQGAGVSGWLLDDAAGVPLTAPPTAAAAAAAANEVEPLDIQGAGVSGWLVFKGSAVAMGGPAPTAAPTAA